MGDPDLSAEDAARQRGEPRRGLVVFPVESLAPAAPQAGPGDWLRDWAIVGVAIVVAALMIGVALLVR